MKLANMKTRLMKGLGVAALAGAALAVAAPAAQAQRVFFGVRVGAPVYVAPAPAPVYVAPAPVVYAGPGYYGGVYFRDYDAWRAHFYVDHRFDHRHFYRR